MDVLYILVGILIGVILLIMLCNYIYCKYYVDPTESYPLATLTIVISMSIGLCSVLLIPIDIFLITYKGDTVANISIDRTNLNLVINSIYAILLFVAFVLVPFAYFYADSGIEDISESNTNNVSQKIWHSMKYTVSIWIKKLFFIVFCAILIVCGLFFKQGNQNLNEYKWVTVLLDTEHSKSVLKKEGEQAISFVISVLSIIGMIFLIFYTGYGLGALPLFLIKGKKSLSTAHQEIEFDKEQIRDRIRALLEKSGKRNLSQKEKKELNKLRDDELNLDKKLNKISSVLESDALVTKLLSLLTPFRVIIGVTFLTFSILILVSLFITSLDRYLNSPCGLKCGFVLEQKNYTNYMDSLLLYLSKYLHFDHIFFAVINIYVYICSIYGFVHIGVRFLCFKIVEIRKKSTYPQGLLIGSFLLSIMILAFMLEIQTLAPQYSTFGTQSFKNSFNHQNIPCSLSLTSSLNLKDNECIISNIAQLCNRISVSFPLFSTIFYMSNWLLILVLLMSLIYAAMCKTEDVMDDIESEDQEEKIGLKDCEDNI